MGRLPGLYRHGLERNIVKYAWYKVVTKRLFFPLITIQLVNAGKVSVSEIALIVVISSIVQMVLQLPGGYFADKVGNKRSILFGAIIALPSPLFYIFMPNFWGGLIASILFFGGWAFQSGAIEAFIHDTLIALGREKDYTRIMGRSQSFGLFANVILIALVPATYSIDVRLPFAIGFISFAVMVWLAASFTDPEAHIQRSFGPKKNPFHAVKSIVTMQNILLFLFAGFLGGVGMKSPEFRELLFQSIGIATIWFGITQSVSSLVGAVLGLVVHKFDRLSARVYYIFDLLIISLTLIVTGWSHNQIVVAGAFVILVGYYRVRLIIIQAKLLATLQHAYKATLLSALEVFTPIGQIIAISILAGFIASSGYSSGYLQYGLAVFAIGSVLLAALLYQIQHKKPELRLAK